MLACCFLCIDRDRGWLLLQVQPRLFAHLGGLHKHKLRHTLALSTQSNLP